MGKFALVVGCNYPGTSHALAGCVNDKRDLEEVLDVRGFDRIIGLEDNEATRENILGYLGQLIGDARQDDLVWFSFSGHGTWTVDRSKDEPDGRDEALYTADNLLILDDDLYRVFTSGHRWTRIVAFSDSCHSGSVNRLAPSLYDGAINDVRDASLAGYRRARFLPPAAWMDEPELPEARTVELAPARGKPRLSALTLSACKDTQVAYDAWFDGRANGAYTYAAIKALEDRPATYRAWHAAIRKLLPSVDFDQVPQLAGTTAQSRWPLFEV